MLTNAVVPPAAASRIAQWDGEAGRESDLIVCVGRLSPEKDQRTLIRAMSTVAGGAALASCDSRRRSGTPRAAKLWRATSVLPIVSSLPAK